jgi:hypothetical protein
LFGSTSDLTGVTHFASQAGGFLLCCRIIPPENSAFRVEGVMKAIMNFGWTRKWTVLLSHHFRVRPEENFEHLSHDEVEKRIGYSRIYYSSTLLQSVIS